jgi:SHS2 domain-containing protein
MTTDRGFRFHDHTADITVECWAPTLEEAFEEAGLAAFEVILDTSTVEPKESVDVNAQGIDMQELLVEWIGQLIALIDINSQFYCRFEVLEIVEKEGSWSMLGRAWGENIDHEKHDTRTEVKAMTYADMKFEQNQNSTTLWFTLDL